MQDQIQQIRTLAEADFPTFVRLVAPKRVWGKIHKGLMVWMEAEERKNHILILLPRGHQKSTIAAYHAAWAITRDPAITIMYISSTSALAQAQLGLIKGILLSPVYRRYWPEMVNEDAGKREKWNNAEFCVDHPKRKAEMVRDPSCFAVGLDSNVVGRHCDKAYLDDIVVPDNAYTEEAREGVRQKYSQLSSIENPDATELVVGTRYHPSDVYKDMIEMEEQVFDQQGNIVDSRRVFDVFERQVEDKGDGSGEFLWPREQREDGQWFGFNSEILSKKKAQYLDKTQFYAQYYNNPNVGDTSGISRDRFQYYDRSKLRFDSGSVFFEGRKLNVFAAVDFAFSLAKSADYTAIVVIGLDELGNLYVLDIDRFKTDKISEYFHRIRALFIKWNFRRLRAEVTVAQAMLVRELKDQYFKPYGLNLSVDEHRPTRNEGSKEERIAAVLAGRYDNQVIWHFEGPVVSALEDELIQAHPSHDDIKDALASAVEIAIPPRSFSSKSNVVQFNGRFGGM